MADEIKESPTIEEPKTESKPENQKQGQSDTDGLLKELEAMGIENAEQIRNMAHASQQTGRAYNEVGELRQQVAALQQKLNERSTAPPQEYDYDPDGGTIDIAKVVRNEASRAVRDFYQNEVLEPQKKAQQMYWNEKYAINTDPDYSTNPVIQEMWNKHEQTPDFQYRVASGQTTPKAEFDKMRLTYFREIAKRSADTIKDLTGSSKSGGSQFVESGETRSVPTQAPIDERNEAANKIVKQRREGTLSGDEALRRLVATYVPKGDPIFRKD